MWNLKSKTSKLIYKTEILTENKHMVTKGEGGTGINQAFGINIYTLLYIKQIICISEVIDISPGNLDSSLCFIQPSISHDVLCIEVK